MLSDRQVREQETRNAIRRAAVITYRANPGWPSRKVAAALGAEDLEVVAGARNELVRLGELPARRDDRGAA